MAWTSWSRWLESSTVPHGGGARDHHVLLTELRASYSDGFEAVGLDRFTGLPLDGLGLQISGPWRTVGDGTAGLSRWIEA